VRSRLTQFVDRISTAVPKDLLPCGGQVTGLMHASVLSTIESFNTQVGPKSGKVPGWRGR
jgi:hypothetical protein